MKTSCIKHPSSDYYIIVRRWQIKWCRENGINEKAGPPMLSLFEYLHNAKSESSRNKNNLWFEISIQDIVMRIQYLASATTVRETKAALIKVGVIQEETPPGVAPRIKFNPAILQDYINEKLDYTPPKTEGYPSGNGEVPPQKRGGIYKEEKKEKEQQADLSFEVFFADLKNHIERFADKQLRSVIKDSDWDRESFLESFINFCYKTERSFDNTPASLNGLASLLSKHAKTHFKHQIKPDLRAAEDLAGQFVNKCCLQWKKVSPWHDRGYGIDKTGKPSILFFEKERDALKAILISGVDKELINAVIENYSSFHPEFGYCWSDYTGNFRIFQGDVARMNELKMLQKNG